MTGQLALVMPPTSRSTLFIRNWLLGYLILMFIFLLISLIVMLCFKKTDSFFFPPCVGLEENILHSCAFLDCRQLLIYDVFNCRQQWQ